MWQVKQVFAGGAGVCNTGKSFNATDPLGNATAISLELCAVVEANVNVVVTVGRKSA